MIKSIKQGTRTVLRWIKNTLISLTVLFVAFTVYVTQDKGPASLEPLTVDVQKESSAAQIKRLITEGNVRRRAEAAKPKVSPEKTTEKPKVSPEKAAAEKRYHAMIRLQLMIKANLRDPDSYDRDSWSYYIDGPMTVITIKYRARNGFGGMAVETMSWEFAL